MGPRSHHATQEGDAFCLPRDERTLVRKVQINPRTTAKDLVKRLEETGTKVSKLSKKRNVPFSGPCLSKIICKNLNNLTDLHRKVLKHSFPCLLNEP